MFRTLVLRALAMAAAALTVLLIAGPAPVDPLRAAPVASTTRQIAVPTAPMGWASWNSFAAKIDYTVIKQQVDAFVASASRRPATSTSTSTRAGGRAPATARATSPSTPASGPAG